MHQQRNINEALHTGSDAINELFARHYRASLRVAHRILHSREDAEDAVQTAYCAAFRNFHEFRAEASFRTWITRIVVNCCLAQLRKRRARPHTGLDDVQRIRPISSSDAVTPETICYLRELQTAHTKAASGLSQDLRDIYAPCVISGIAFSTVAHHLGLTTAAAKSRLFRARRKVEQALQPVIQRRAA